MPLVGLDGKNLGLIQLTDKQAGEFNAEDEAILQGYRVIQVDLNKLTRDTLEE